MEYVDYEFYTNEFHGNIITELDFPRYADKAFDVLVWLTFGRVETLFDYQEEASEKVIYKVKKAVCRLAEVVQDIEVKEAVLRSNEALEQSEYGLKGKVISSISSGSESISYSTSNSLSDDTISASVKDMNARKKLYMDVIRPYLSNTGLLYAGI